MSHDEGLFLRGLAGSHDYPPHHLADLLRVIPADAINHRKKFPLIHNLPFFSVFLSVFAVRYYLKFHFTDALFVTRNGISTSIPSSLTCIYGV